MNIAARTLIALAVVFALTATSAMAQGIVSIPVEERDHVWVVNQNGNEVPLTGDWVVIGSSHWNSRHPAGTAMTLPPEEDAVISFSSEGTVVGPDNMLWTQFSVQITDDYAIQAMERVDTASTPNLLYYLEATEDDGTHAGLAPSVFDPVYHGLNSVDLVVYQKVLP